MAYSIWSPIVCIPYFLQRGDYLVSYWILQIAHM